MRRFRPASKAQSAAVRASSGRDRARLYRGGARVRAGQLRHAVDHREADSARQRVGCPSVPGQARRGAVVPRALCRLGQRGRVDTRKCGCSCRPAPVIGWPTRVRSWPWSQLKPPNLEEDEQFYKADLSYFWSQVCLATVDVSVPGRGGTIDMAASQKQAEAVAAELTAASAGGAAPTVGNGARYCLTPEQLIVQPTAFRQAVYALAPGQGRAGARKLGVRGGPGAVPDDHPVQRPGGRRHRVWWRSAPALRLTRGPSRETPTAPASASILKAADVKVDPAYGSWTTALPSPPYIPQVWPAGQAPPEPVTPPAEGHGRGPRPRPARPDHRRIARRHRGDARCVGCAPPATLRPLTVPGARSFDYLYESAATSKRCTGHCRGAGRIGHRRGPDHLRRSRARPRWPNAPSSCCGPTPG